MDLYTAEQMREIDRKAIEERGIPSVELMENAARALVEEVRALPIPGPGFQDGPTAWFTADGHMPSAEEQAEFWAMRQRSVLVLCGPGNNGGDGVAAARMLLEAGWRVRCALVGPREKMTEDCLEMERRLISAGGFLEDFNPEDRGRDVGYDVAVDALFGVGLNSELRPDAATAVRRMATCGWVVSADVPSGIHADTGGVMGMAVRADVTVTFSRGKPGLYVGKGAVYSGRVVVADNIDNAIALSRKYQYSLRIVTLDGELLSAGGSMTGGAFKNTSNLLGRKREIEELEQRCQKALKAAEMVQQELVMDEEQLKQQREELEQLKQQKQSAFLEQNTIRMNLAQLDDKIQEIQESSRDMVLENSHLEEQIREIERNQKELLNGVQGLETKNLQEEQQIETLSGQLEEEKERREQLAKDLSAVQLASANLQQKYQFIQENVRRVRGEMDKLDQELSQLEGSAGASSQAIGQRMEEIQKIKEQIKELAQKAEGLEQEGLGFARAREEKTGEQKRLFDKREELSGRMNHLDKELFRLQSQKEKLDERLERHVEYMWSEYELTATTAQAFFNPQWTSLAEMKRQAGTLKESIRALGNVNVNAIEDYKEISERYEFMRTQHEDLVKAEETLMGIIEELDTGMRRQFEEKFKEIRREFDQVFKELFGGGHGQLELVEDEDILEAGIQIISQPPGKKLQNMMQLSGGEKALTAIALLFAIQNLKPSPFCLLDEIEAALDDSNVDRFAGYLHKLTRNTQFIVITHRRGTMVSADRLYGITMQEKGVSTLVSVNLIEDSLEGEKVG